MRLVVFSNARSSILFAVNGVQNNFVRLADYTLLPEVSEPFRNRFISFLDVGLFRRGC